MCSWPCTTVIRPPQDVDVLAVLVLGRLASMQQITESYAHSRNDILYIISVYHIQSISNHLRPIDGGGAPSTSRNHYVQ